MTRCCETEDAQGTQGQKRPADVIGAGLIAQVSYLRSMRDMMQRNNAEEFLTALDVALKRLAKMQKAAPAQATAQILPLRKVA